MYGMLRHPACSEVPDASREPPRCQRVSTRGGQSRESGANSLLPPGFVKAADPTFQKAARGQHVTRGSGEDRAFRDSKAPHTGMAELHSNITGKSVTLRRRPDATAPVVMPSSQAA